jgi:plasmid stabilization system protein ParE
MTQAATTTMALVASPRTDDRTTTDDSSLAAAARRLAEAAVAFRAAAETPRDGSDFAMSFGDVEVALGDLAAGAELSAYAVTAAERPHGVSAAHAPPTAAARSLSWRLHGLRRELRDARGVCAEVNRVLKRVAGD